MKWFADWLIYRFKDHFQEPIFELIHELIWHQIY
jgi:hypothetical protein